MQTPPSQRMRTADLRMDTGTGGTVPSPDPGAVGGEHSVAPLQQEGCVGFTAPGGCGSRSRTAAALRPARSSVVSHGPTAPRRDSCALTQRRRLPRIPPLTSLPPLKTPPGSPGQNGRLRGGGAERAEFGMGGSSPNPKCCHPLVLVDVGGRGHGMSPWELRGHLCARWSSGVPLGYAELGLRDGVTLGTVWGLHTGTHRD